LPEDDGVTGIYVAVGVRDGDGVILGVSVGEGVLNSPFAVGELVHENKSNKDKQNTLLMKMRFEDFII
jgi:hypothetical protein